MAMVKTPDGKVYGDSVGRRAVLGKHVLFVVTESAQSTRVG